MPQQTKPDVLAGWRFALLCLAVLAATSAPYFYHWAHTPDGARYHACSTMNLGDIYSYLAWMKQAEQGHWLFSNLYDPMPQERTQLLPYFLALGLLTRTTGLDPMVMLHLARVAAAALLLLTAHWLCRRELPEAPLRTTAFLLLTMATGVPALVPYHP